MEDRSSQRVRTLVTQTAMAWRKHLPIHGEEQEPKERGESDADYAARRMPHWGLVEMIAWTLPSVRRRRRAADRGQGSAVDRAGERCGARYHPLPPPQSLSPSRPA